MPASSVAGCFSRLSRVSVKTSVKLVLDIVILVPILAAHKGLTVTSGAFGSKGEATVVPTPAPSSGWVPPLLTGLRYVVASGEFHLFLSTGSASGESTQIGFEVEDIDTVVADLRARGVVFEEIDALRIT